MSIRKAIGAVKDRTSIGIAKVARNMAPDLEIAIVKATSHHHYPADEKYIMDVVHLVSSGNGYVHACVAAAALSKRLSKTRDWVVAVKSLVLVHRLLADGAHPLFQHELMHHATRKGNGVLNMDDFREEAHANSWDHSKFVKTYAMYLDHKLKLIMFDRNNSNGRLMRTISPPGRGQEDYGYAANNPVMMMMRRSRSYGDVNDCARRGCTTPLHREMTLERIFARMTLLQRLLNRVLACRPTGMAMNSRLVLVAMYRVVRESFQLYADICDILTILLDKFFDMEYPDGVRAFNTYATAAKQIDELILFYNWCNDVGLSRKSEIPDVQRITDKLLETLKEFLRGRGKGLKWPEGKEAPPALEQDMNETKALPAPPPPPSDPQPEPETPEDLVNLRDDDDGVTTVHDQGNTFELALFADPPAFSSDGKDDWELALVESVSNLSNQKNAMGVDALLNGMYDQGMVRLDTSTSALPLPAPDESVNEDPFAASLAIPPPSYVQMYDMEKKQQVWSTHGQQLWQQYASQGPDSLGTMSGQGFYTSQKPTPYGMPPGEYYYSR